VYELIREARSMTPASVEFARKISDVRTPEHLVALRTTVREHHRGEFAQIQEALNETLGATGATTDYVNVFYASAEMALMERVGRQDPSASDRGHLRGLWQALLAATQTTAAGMAERPAA
jgi:xanthine dehydrogenase iron-sulfur cluster and FAD-binding subunit A